MAKLIIHCDYCKKVLEQSSSLRLSETETLVSYKCGHSYIEHSAPKLTLTKSHLHSLNGIHIARDYQVDGVQFIVDSGFNCILGDKQRLGKTPQALLALRTSMEHFLNGLPCLIIVGGANLYQWIDEHKHWVCSDPSGIYPIIGSKSWIPPGFKTYIISRDTFSKGDVAQRVSALNPGLCIVDEAHNFKNTSSKRSQALVDFIRSLNTAEYTDAVAHGVRTQVLVTKQKCGVILLTGTPILNRADEYFVPLNLVAPKIFPSLEHFRRAWCVQNDKGQWTKINPNRLEAFHKQIAPFYLRREWEDVYKQLPKANRMFTMITIEDDTLKKLYNATLDKIDADIAAGRATWAAQQDNLMMLRKITGLAKADFVANLIEVGLDDDARTKYAIGIHHHDVRDLLKYKLAQYGVMTIDGTDSAEEKFRVMDTFRDATERVLCMGASAVREGMDFLYVENVILVERMWSSALEEQFECRFYNPDAQLMEDRGLKDKVTNYEYIVAKGTIDEFYWFDMVESKRQIFGETVVNNWDIGSDPQSFRDLLERTTAGRL